MHPTPQMPFDDDFIKSFKSNKLLIVAGSTWPKDEDLVLKAFTKIKENGVKLIIAPHEIEASNTINLIKKINGFGITYSLYTSNPNTNSDVLILDTIGLLSKLDFSIQFFDHFRSEFFTGFGNRFWINCFGLNRHQ